ncbi:MAG: arsenate reductase (glutaredoxin) [Mariprofundaceae bacterium]
MHVRIYHNPRCSKSRQALTLLRERGIEPEVVEYLKHPPTAAEIARLLDWLGMEPEALLRKGEAEYKAHFRGRELSREETIALMAQYPKVIERPIVVVDDARAVVGRPPERVLELLAG